MAFLGSFVFSAKVVFHVGNVRLSVVFQCEVVACAGVLWRHANQPRRRQPTLRECRISIPPSPRSCMPSFGNGDDPRPSLLS
jgi:hypothetical protein